MSNILPVYTYDHPILRKKLKPVAEINEEVIGLALAMHETMRNADGIGLAANQVGRDMQMLVLNVPEDEGDGSVSMTMINPVIEAVSEEEELFEEGCLSLPDIRADVLRPEAVQVRFTDPSMKEHDIEVEGLLARVIQHEVDHLHGRYFFDYLAPMRRGLLKRRLLAVKRGEVEAEYPLYGK